jgi:hypothetical protein
MRQEALVTTRPGTGDFFRIGRLLMALAKLGRRRCRFLPLPYPLSITAGLLAAALLALVAGPIPLGSLPTRPEARRIRAGRATVPRLGMRGREPLLAPLQQTNPRPGVGGDLRFRRRGIMLDHGPRERQLPKVKSRQRSLKRYSAPGRFGPLPSCASNLGPA